MIMVMRGVQVLGQIGARETGTLLCRAPVWGLDACPGLGGGCLRAWGREPRSNAEGHHSELGGLR